ncbi:MAG: DnaJ domain-containing protein [Methylobacter sp.]|nr:DnaJ domain-containing protein [Methylobacter sp.]
MKTPYAMLDVAEQATDTEIKQAYLHKVKQFPPDHHHEQFQQIQQAYESIKDLSCRTKYALFTLPEADFNSLLDHAFSSERATSISSEHFNKLLRASIDDKRFIISVPELIKAS